MSNPYTFIPFSLLADFFFTLNDGAAQHLQLLGMPVAQCTFMRFLLTSILLALWMYKTTPPLLLTIHSQENHILWLRGALNALGLVIVWKSFDYITLSEGITLFHLRPFPTGFICWWLLNERFTLRQLIACLISFSAVLMVVQPEFLFHQHIPTTSHRALGVLLISVAVLLSSIDILLLRKIGDRDLCLMLLTFSISGCVDSIVWSLVLQTPFVPLTWPITGYTLLMTAGGAAGQIAFTTAIKYAEGSKIACIGYSQIIFAVLLQCLWTGIVPSALAFMGMGIIIVTGVWCALGSREEEQSVGKDEEVALDAIEREGLITRDGPEDGVRL